MSEETRAGTDEVIEGGLPGPTARGRPAVAASILGVLLIGGYFAAAPGGVRMGGGEYLLNAAILAVAFWFPAMRIGSLADVRRLWLPLLGWALAWTLIWDLASSGIFFGERAFFQGWWIVYPAGVATLGALMLLHGAVVARAGAASPRRPPAGRG